MKIDLPDIDIQPSWTEASQLKKIFEEAGEVAEAVALSDPVNTIKELLDTMQTCKTLIAMTVKEYSWDINKFITQHNEKLKTKGYLKEGEEL